MTITNASQHNGPQLVGNQFHEFNQIITISIFMLCVACTKVLYSRLTCISHRLPESCMLILLGVISACLIKVIFHGIPENLKLTPNIFFRILLPPIVLESAYCLYNKIFASLLRIILIFAVIGTLLNFIFIGGGMLLLYTYGVLGPPGIILNVKSILLFSSLIVAVDPVAVLAIFQDIGVDLELYFIVFGESLLNDAVTVVLYEIIIAFMYKSEIYKSELVIGFLAFFTVSLGGLAIGIVIGAITCITVRIESHYQYLILIIGAYMAYILAMTVHWSGIISMIGCGIVQARYGFKSMHNESVDILRHVTESLATISEAMIFFYLGTALLERTLFWHTGFCLFALLLCIIARFVVSSLLSFIINWFRIDYRHITFTEQFVLFYGGLRGAVSFSLCVLIEPEIMPGFNRAQKEQVTALFFTATMFIIVFTVGVMGTTMKPLVKFLNIKMMEIEANPDALFVVVSFECLEYCNEGIESIIGLRVPGPITRMLKRFDKNVLFKVLKSSEKRHFSNLDLYTRDIIKINEKSKSKEADTIFYERRTMNFPTPHERPIPHNFQRQSEFVRLVTKLNDYIAITPDSSSNETKPTIKSPTVTSPKENERTSRILSYLNATSNSDLSS